MTYSQHFSIKIIKTQNTFKAKVYNLVCCFLNRPMRRADVIPALKQQAFHPVEEMFPSWLSVPSVVGFSRVGPPEIFSQHADDGDSSLFSSLHMTLFTSTADADTFKVGFLCS